MFQYDYDKVSSAMTRTLDAVDVPWGEDGIEQNLSTWAHNKAQLVDLLRKHPNWNEDAMAIITKVGIANQANTRMVVDICCDIHNSLCFRYGNGEFSGYLHFSDWENQQISVNMAAKLNRTGAGDLVEPIVGQKTTRYLRQLFLTMGVAEDDKAFWKLFQRLADEVNVPEFVEYPYVISVNPADYLTMSYGTNWASCHIINPAVASTRNGSHYDGCYKAGCLSYLCDPSSIITYTVDKLPADVLELPYTRRHTRQMFFINIPEQAVMQSRLYPYTHDEKTILAQRTVLQGILAQCFGIENKWDVEKGHRQFTTALLSHHYRDYDYWEDNMITTSTPYGKVFGWDMARIGNTSYCLQCGDGIGEADAVFCYDCEGSRMVVCAECGHEGYEDDDDMREINGCWYCEDCCFWCDYHNEWEVGDCDDFTHVYEYGDVCNEALEDSGDFFFDEAWEEWLNVRDYPDYVTCGDGCRYHDAGAALEAGYVPCTECDDWYYAGDMHETLNGEYMCNWCYKQTNRDDCPHCGATYNTECDETCPHCGVIIEAGEAV